MQRLSKMKEMVLFVMDSNTLHFIIFILLLIRNTLCSEIKVGYLFQIPDPSNPSIDVFQKAVFSDFTQQIMGYSYSENFLFFNSSCNTRGDDLSAALEKFKFEGVKHIFSPITFSNFTFVNEKLQDYGMILWSSTAKRLKSCHRNIVYYGSERKFFEQCIFTNF